MPTLVKKNMDGAAVFGPILKLDRPGIKKRRFVHRNGNLIFQVQENGSSLGARVSGFGIVDEFDGRLNLIFGRTAKQRYLAGDDPGGLKPKGVVLIMRVVKFMEERIFFRTFMGEL